MLCSLRKLGYCVGAGGTGGDSSGTAGGTLGWFRKSLLILGGLLLLNEFDLATFDVLGNITPFCTGCTGRFGSTCDGVEIREDTEAVLWSPLTMVFKSRISVGVISEGSTIGSGLFVDFSI